MPIKQNLAALRARQMLARVRKTTPTKKQIEAKAEDEEALLEEEPQLLPDADETPPDDVPNDVDDVPEEEPVPLDDLDPELVEGVLELGEEGLENLSADELDALEAELLPEAAPPPNKKAPPKAPPPKKKAKAPPKAKATMVDDVDAEPELLPDNVAEEPATPTMQDLMAEVASLKAQLSAQNNGASLAPNNAVAPPTGLDETTLNATPIQSLRQQQMERLNQVQGALEQQQAAMGVPVASSMTTLYDLATTLRGTGYRFSVTNVRNEVLQVLEDAGMVEQARVISRNDPEKLVSLISPFISGSKIVPSLLALGFKPIHQTAIDANYPLFEKYELTLTNGTKYITVIGRHDWENGFDATTIRYASNAELLRYGVTQALATASVGRALIAPSAKVYGKEARALPNLTRNALHSLSSAVVRNRLLHVGQMAIASKDNRLLQGELLGCKDGNAVLLCDDGYVVVPATGLYT